MKCFRDGDQFVVTRGDFVNLQESPAVFVPVDSEDGRVLERAGVYGLSIGSLQAILEELQQGAKPVLPTPPQFAECQAALAGMRQVLDNMTALGKAAYSAGTLSHRGSGDAHFESALSDWNAIEAKMQAALATDAGRAHLEADAKREALGRRLSERLEHLPTCDDWIGQLCDCDLEAIKDEARAAGWLQEEGKVSANG